MESTLRYIENDQKCKAAIMEIRGHITVPQWVDKNAQLFKSISIQPPGRPSIADCHCNGVHYKWISNFHHLHNSLLGYLMMEED